MSFRLAQEELDACRDAFIMFDKDRSGQIDVWELKLVLESMGQKPTDEEVFEMVAEVDDNKSGAIGEPRVALAACHSAAPFPRPLTPPCAPPPCSAEFAEFLRVITNQRSRRLEADDDTDMLDAFMACGGNADKSGCVERSTLVRIIKQDFGLEIDIEELIDAIDADGSGEIEFGEFKELLSPEK